MTRKKKQKSKEKAKLKKQKKTGTKDEDHNQEDSPVSPSQVRSEEGEIRECEISRTEEKRPEIHEITDGDQPEENRDEAELEQRGRRQELKTDNERQESCARRRRERRYRESRSRDRDYSRSVRNAQSPRYRRRSPKGRLSQTGGS